MTDQTINPGDWVRLGHEKHPYFRLEGTVHEPAPGCLAVGVIAIGRVDDGLFFGYTIFDHKPAEPVWAKDRVIVDKYGDLFVRDGVKWRHCLGAGIGSFTYTAAEVAAYEPITRIDPREQS